MKWVFWEIPVKNDQTMCLGRTVLEVFKNASEDSITENLVNIGRFGFYSQCPGCCVSRWFCLSRFSLLSEWGNSAFSLPLDLTGVLLIHCSLL